MTKPETMTLADYVRELTQPHTHREHYTTRRRGTWYGQDHVTLVPPLIAQLAAGDIPSATAEEGPRAGFGSKPAARLEALDAVIEIDDQAARWVRTLGHDDPGTKIDPKTRRPIPGSGAIACINLLHGLTASADPVVRRQIERDIRHWWTKARIVTGWDSAPWSPDNTCPVCAERGSLKIRLLEQIGMCTNCRETWDDGNIGLLAGHIRAESAQERRPKEGRGPCWCPVPKPIVPDLSRLCPVCGSARCRHALETARPDHASERIGA